ncbi:hypothetical protein AB0G05_30615 [Nonomuraea wenchangensis]
MGHGQVRDDEVQAVLATRLPLTASVASIALFVRDGGRWHRRAEFPLAGAGAGAGA